MARSWRSPAFEDLVGNVVEIFMGAFLVYLGYRERIERVSAALLSEAPGTSSPAFSAALISER